MSIYKEEGGGKKITQTVQSKERTRMGGDRRERPSKGQMQAGKSSAYLQNIACPSARGPTEAGKD